MIICVPASFLLKNDHQQMYWNLSIEILVSVQKMWSSLNTPKTQESDFPKTENSKKLNQKHTAQCRRGIKRVDKTQHGKLSVLSINIDSNLRPHSFSGLSVGHATSQATTIPAVFTPETPGRRESRPIPICSD